MEPGWGSAQSLSQAEGFPFHSGPKVVLQCRRGVLGFSPALNLSRSVAAGGSRVSPCPPTMAQGDQCAQASQGLGVQKHTRRSLACKAAHAEIPH